MKKSRPVARASSKYTDYPVREAMELMDFLSAKMPDASRTKLKTLLSNRVVYVDHVITTQYNFPLRPGMLVQISKQKNKKEFRNSQMQLLYEDAYVLIINKKEGLASATAKGRERTTLSILREYVQRSGKERRVYPVHKLDREASGIMIFTKDEKTQKNLQEHWANAVQEYYLVAVLRGELEKETGIITSWMTDDQLYISQDAVPSGITDKAITRYKRIKTANGLSMVELYPKDIRKSQVRLHMDALRHPIVGDLRYDPEAEANAPRFALHGFRLLFRHPVTGEQMKFETPYPDTFRKMVARTGGQPAQEKGE